MKIPMKSMPIGSQLNYSTTTNGVDASGIACTLCKAACEVLPIGARQACQIACNVTVC